MELKGIYRLFKLYPSVTGTKPTGQHMSLFLEEILGENGQIPKPN